MPGRLVRGDDHFVGRDEELAVIGDACISARGGRARLVVVRGEAGIGKTTLCEHAADQAQQNGFAVGWGRCWADGGAPPLWPWSAVLTELAGRDGDQLLAEDPGRPGLDPERFARFAAVGNLLAERARAAPLLIVIDDAHAADTAALLFARYLVRALDRRPVVTILTRRSGRDVAEPDTARLLDELEREGSVISLGSFDRHETAALMKVHGVHVEEYGLVSALTRITEGNPLLLARAVNHVSSSHDLSGVEQVIGDALAELSPPHRRIVALAAVLGTDVLASDVAALAGSDETDVLDALDSASTAGLMDVGATGCAFTHDLVRKTALTNLSPMANLEAHARAVELTAADNRPAAVTRRAHHALAAAARSDLDAMRAVSECRAAARVLVMGFDYERAAALLDSARELAERLTPPVEHVDVLLEWADALLACGRLTDARAAFARAADVADGAHDPQAFARAALGLGGVWVNEHRALADRQRVLGLQRAALDALPADDRALRATLRVRLAAEAVYDGAPVGPVLDALAEARELGDLRVLAEALSLTHHALLAPEHLDKRLPLADELIEMASTVGDGLRVLFGLMWKTVDLYLLGDPQAERTLGELRQRADAVGCRSISYIVSAIDVMRLVRAGKLGEAEAAADRCFELGLDVGDADAQGYYAAHVFTIRWLQGREHELLDLVRDMAFSPTLVAPEFSFRAVGVAMMARAGLVQEATTALHDLTADGLDALPRSSTWLVGMVGLADAASALGDGELASAVYQRLLPFADRPVMPSLAVSCFGSVERVLGLAVLAAGDASTAVTHLERAVEANVRLGNRPLTLVARADLAEALLVRSLEGDRAHARAELEAAAAGAEMAMADRAAAWRRRADELKALDELASHSDDRCAGELRRDGKGWVICVGEHKVNAPNLVGFSYLGTLLEHPGEEIPAIELCGGTPIDQAAHDILDRDALNAYRARVHELDVELADAEADADLVHAERLRDERDALRSELTAALAMPGRSRRFVDAPERARTAVRKAISRALNVIDDADSTLGGELRSTITTGRSCSYTPDPRQPRRWSVRA